MTKTYGFIGLGTMGYHMARHIAAAHPGHTLVYNRTTSKAIAHAEETGSEAVDLDVLATRCDVILLCLSTSADVRQVLDQMELKPGMLVIDCTSSDPEETRATSAAIASRCGARLVDAPVSGGPKGASAGTVTCMLGGEPADVEEAQAVVAAFANPEKIVHVGPLGTGDATKAINNMLNTAHLLLAAEGCLALKKLGVEPATALQVINASSGASLQTSRFPDNILSRKFAYGFALALMYKDCGIAHSLTAAQTPSATLIPEVFRLISAAEAEFGGDKDYTEVVKLLESRVGLEL